MGKRKGGNSSLKKMIVDAILSANDPATKEHRDRIALNKQSEAMFTKAVTLAPGGYELMDPKTGNIKFYELKCTPKKLGKQPVVVCKTPSVKGDKTLRKMLSDFANRFGRLERYAEKHGGLDGIKKKGKGRKRPCGGRGRTQAGKCRKARRSRR